MLLAEKKKRENISEYIIHMYQTELLIRNYNLDLGEIKRHIIDNIPDENLDQTGKRELLSWYEGLISAMQQEKIEKEGHLREVQNLVRQLSDLSLSLQTENKDYQSVFHAARPHIRASIQVSNGLVNDPIQACLNGVFGLLITRMRDQEIDAEQQEALEHFGNVLSLLSYHYGNSK